MSVPFDRFSSRHETDVRLAPNASASRRLAGGLNWLVIFAAVLGGCTSTPAPPTIFTFSHFRANSLESAPVRRVLLLPMSNETQFPYVEQEIGDALATELRAAGLFEVVMGADDAEQPCAWTLRTSGTFDERQLIELAERYQVDAVLYGSVTNYSPYWPPRVGVNLQLVGTHEAVALASVDGLWDARDEHIAAQAQQFYFARLTPKVTVPDSDLMLHAPQYFQKFVASQIVHLLAGPVHGMPAGLDGFPVVVPPEERPWYHPAVWWPWLRRQSLND